MSKSLIDTLEGRKRLQQALLDNGYDIGPDGVDGYLGKNTALAIINCRIANKLSHQDQALIDTDLERCLGLLTIQEPAVKAAGNFVLNLGLNYLLNRLSVATVVVPSRGGKIGMLVAILAGALLVVALASYALKLAIFG